MTRRLILLTTLALALIAGALIAWVILPQWRRGAALGRITAPDRAARAEAWDTLSTDALDYLPEIQDALGMADDEILTESADRLRALGVWGWDTIDTELIFRDCRARVLASDEATQVLAVDLLRTCPLDAPHSEVGRVFWPLVDSTYENVRIAALEAAVAWAGSNRVHIVPVPEHRTLRRAHALTIAWGTPQTPTPIGQLLQSLLRMDGDLAVALNLGAVVHGVERASTPEATDPLTIAIMRYGSTPETRDCLETLAAEGSDLARYALAASDPALECVASRRVLEDPSEPIARRRIAAWRCDDIDLETTRTILNGDPADPDASVWAAVLLAERRLARNEATDVAERWIRSYDDDEKRAGALLAALLGVHGPLLREAFDAEDQPRVRTIQRLALFTLDEHVDDGVDPLELGHRAMHADGDVRPDVLLMLLAAGDLATLERLVELPETPTTGSVRARAWLIERFVPQWHERIGRPLGGNADVLALHFDSLRAMWWMTKRRLVYVAETRAFSSLSR